MPQSQLPRYSNDGPQTLPPDYRQWAVDVFSWDAIFPLFLFAVSAAAAWILPNNRGFAEILMICLPIVGVLIRFASGHQKITLNHCSRRIRMLQLACLGVAVVLFMACDFAAVLGAFLKNKQEVFTTSDYYVLGCMLVVYWLLVTCAMYPGRERVNVLMDSGVARPDTWDVVRECCPRGDLEVILVKCLPDRQLLAYCPDCESIWSSPEQLHDEPEEQVDLTELATAVAIPTSREIANSPWQDELVGVTNHWSLAEINGYLTAWIHRRSS